MSEALDEGCVVGADHTIAPRLFVRLPQERRAEGLGRLHGPQPRAVDGGLDLVAAHALDGLRHRQRADGRAGPPRGVHDAVRPFITRGLIDAVVGAARRTGAAICALPVSETVKRVRGDEVEATIDRTGLWTVQTPQAFSVALLREAHEKARRDGVVGTDDAALVERLGHAVKVVRGLERNLKITTPDDLRRARRMALS